MEKKYTNQEAHEIMEYLGDLYRRCLIDQGDIHKQQFVKYIDTTLGILEESQEILLRKTYFESSERKWWMHFYSLSTYYREKVRASQQFLHCLM